MQFELGWTSLMALPILMVVSMLYPLRQDRKQYPGIPAVSEVPKDKHWGVARI